MEFLEKNVLEITPGPKGVSRRSTASSDGSTGQEGGPSTVDRSGESQVVGKGCLL